MQDSLGLTVRKTAERFLILLRLQRVSDKISHGLLSPEREDTFPAAEIADSAYESYQIPEEVHFVSGRFRKITEYINTLFRGDADTGKT